MITETKPKMSWSFEDIWNGSIAVDERPVRARDYIWATDIGKNYWERYMKMLGIQYSDPFDERTRRKFAAGFFFEDLCGYVLERAGILQAHNERLEIPKTPEHLKIVVKHDFRAGGITDWKQAKKNVEEAKFPEVIEKIAFKLVEYFSKKYPKGLKEILLEIKSVNSMVFWSKKDYLEEAYPHHQLQLYTQLKAFKKEEGHIVYISKDDLTIKELCVFCPNEKLEELWNKDIKGITQHYKDKIAPPMPEQVIFDPRKKLRFQWNKEKHILKGSFDMNWEIRWSPYITKMTGMNREKWEPKAKALAREKNAELKEKYKKNYPNE